MNLLIVIIFISAGLYVYGDFIKNRAIKYIFKPITTVLIIVLALLQQPDGYSVYSYLIISGLVLSLIGDIYLMLPSDKFVHGLVSFLIAHIFYIVAFGWGFGPYFEIIYLIPAAIYTLVFLWILLPKTGKMKLPVLVYALVLMIFLWQATGRYYYLAETTALYTFAGAVLFVISDSILAYGRFVKNYKLSPLLIHITYWGAQVAIALSI